MSLLLSVFRWWAGPRPPWRIPPYLLHVTDSMLDTAITPALDPTSATCPIIAPPIREFARPTIARVLHVINGEHYAGAERVQDLLALNLPKQGFDVGFACVKPERFAECRKARESPIHDVPMRWKFDIAPARRLAALIREEKYDLVHTHTPRSAFIGRLAAAWSRVPVVHHLHSPTAADTTYRLRNWLNAAIERTSLTGVDAVITVSQSLARYAQRIGIAPEKVRVVPNGVPSRATLTPRGKPRGAWMLGAVALFRPRKGLEMLMHALASLKAARLHVTLRAIGSFETSRYETEIKSLAVTLGIDDRLEWRGFTSNINEELDQIDLFVLPSLFGEGMPMVVLEAMAAGVPVVGTNVEGVPEVVRDGLEGLIVPPGDPLALAAAIEEFIAARVDWTTLRFNAYRRQRERFSEQTMAAGVAEVYRQVLGDGNDRAAGGVHESK